MFGTVDISLLASEDNINLSMSINISLFRSEDKHLLLRNQKLLVYPPGLESVAASRLVDL